MGRLELNMLLLTLYLKIRSDNSEDNQGLSGLIFCGPWASFDITQTQTKKPNGHSRSIASFDPLISNLLLQFTHG